MRWLDQFRCRCPEKGDSLDPPNKAPAVGSDQDTLVADHSPARLLELSLTSPETRAEWRREYIGGVGLGGYYIYKNEQRDLSITQAWRMGWDYISTPFKLNKGELAIVEKALDRFNDWKRLEAERAALARLTAPAGGAP